VPDVALDRFEAPFGGRRVQPAAANEVKPSEHGVQRRPQLMRDRREEFVFHAVRGFTRRARLLRVPGAIFREPPRVLHGGHDRGHQQRMHDEQGQMHVRRDRRDRRGVARGQQDSRDGREQGRARPPEPGARHYGRGQQQELTPVVDQGPRESIEHHDGPDAGKRQPVPERGRENPCRIDRSCGHCGDCQSQPSCHSC
jgi:hypothetical protein